jgi:hypothetical protein
MKAFATMLANMAAILMPAGVWKTRIGAARNRG